MTAAIDDLRRVPLFAGMTDRSLEAIVALASEKEFVDGETLTVEGDEGDAFYLLLDGRVDVTRGGVEVRVMERGDFIGEISLVDGRPRTATATALGPVLALVIRRDAFLDLMDRFAAVRLGVMMALTERIRSDEAGSGH
jgi:CRP-like cAMP-binding protein